MTGRHGIDQLALRDVILRSPPNWTAVIFFAILGALHLCIALPALVQGREGHMSLILGTIFLAVAGLSTRARFEMSILPNQRRLRLRNGIGRFSLQRYISFASVHGVRLTFLEAPDYPISRIELLCDNEDIECPPTQIPRQQALCLAMLMNVRLIKVCGGEEMPEPAERHQHVSRI